ncbi:PfkB family carbohydrate kinase [Anaerobaca lacustris]|uniref:Ribokinase n=1 Tax=Anaerobaca lacustris TaxID=3044600 RepID=A0AAW6U0M4_9BACT|nr:PfkB family carbohydrate kinase [Sedimentisphaerales bacterium M17dextr]
MVERIPRIVVVGSTYIDMAFKCATIPSAGQMVSGSALSYSLAGPGPLEAVQAALCGCGVHLISKVGGDVFGAMAKKSLADYKVNVDYVCTAEAKNTGVVVTHVNAAGENGCCHYSGANCALLPADIEMAEELIAEADICLIHGCLPQEAIVKALRCSELHGTKVIFNPSRPTEQESRHGLDLPIEYFTADILIPNLFEAADITDQSAATIRTAKMIGSELVARGARCAVITMGARGAMVVDRGGADHVPAFEVDLVDHTGSGDAFAGALAAYCAVKDDVREGVKFASAAGALACAKFGGLESLPSKAEIIQLLQREDIDLLPRN